MRTPRRFAVIALLAPVLSVPPSSAASEEDSVRLYRTREEQREAGLARQLTPWLSATTLLEAETGRERVAVDDARNFWRHESNASLQIGLEATPTAWLKGESVLEYDTDVDKLRADEYILAAEWGAWELAVGKMYLPFGEFFSRFVTGPVLEFGETRDTAATLAYDFSDRFDVSISVYQGVAREVDGAGRELDWTFALEAWPDQDLSIGLSLQTDLADSDERLLADQDNRFVRKVPGLSGYLLWIGDGFEVTFEALGATRSFREFESDRDRPVAWNLELGLFLHPKLELALRIEGSRKLEDAPRTQYGAAATLLLHRNTTLTLELLHARFDGNLATDDDDNSFSHSNSVGALLSLAF